MGRITALTNPLGSFAYHYVDDATALGAGNDKGTTRLSSINYPNGQVTNFSYFSTTYDERLQEINNLNPSSAVLSQFNYTYDSKGQMLSWEKQEGSSAATRFDNVYDGAGQLTSAVLKTNSTNAVLHQYYYNFDNACNRISSQLDSSVTKETSNNLNQLTSTSAGGATRFQGTISQPGTVTVNGTPAQQSTSTNFVANPVLSSGTNTVTVVATNGNNVAQTNSYQVVVPAQTAITRTYDLNGNLTNNGAGQTYAWDAENRLITITYIIEKNSSGTVTSTKQFVLCGSMPAEERDATGTTVTKRFFGQGEQISGTNYYFTRDHLGSVREMTDSSGNIQAQYDYDPNGNPTLLAGSNIADFQFGGYYEHQPSGLNLTTYRGYDPTTARWLNRDPIGENGGLNLYDYCGNEPINGRDPSGLNPAAVAAGFIGADLGPDIGLPAAAATGVTSADIGIALAGVGAVGTAAVLSPALVVALLVGTVAVGSYDAYELANSSSSPAPQTAGAAGGAIPPVTPPVASAFYGDEDECHHRLPRQFKPYFETAGIDIEQYLKKLPRALHRLKGTGIHPEYNNDWQDFFDKNPNATPDQILQQMNKLEIKYGISSDIPENT
jgi:RHS repeat-associated protein